MIPLSTLISFRRTVPLSIPELTQQYVQYGRVQSRFQYDVNKQHASGLNAKVGIRNLGPHLRNSAILRTTILIAELRTKKRTAIADLQNLTSAIPQLSPVSCQSATF